MKTHKAWGGLFVIARGLQPASFMLQVVVDPMKVLPGRLNDPLLGSIGERAGFKFERRMLQCKFFEPVSHSQKSYIDRVMQGSYDIFVRGLPSSS